MDASGPSKDVLKPIARQTDLCRLKDHWGIIPRAGGTRGGQCQRMVYILCSKRQQHYHCIYVSLAAPVVFSVFYPIAAFRSFAS